jgi:hypothetical protein
MEYDGETWVQLWDPDEKAMYWYCERTQAAQWEKPGEEDAYSVGGMTDYSTDYSYESGGEYTDSEYGDNNEWQEFWDESAQAKYWYNYNTGEASWTRPATRSMSRGESFMSSVSDYSYSTKASAMPGIIIIIIIIVIITIIIIIVFLLVLTNYIDYHHHFLKNICDLLLIKMMMMMMMMMMMTVKKAIKRFQLI